MQNGGQSLVSRTFSISALHSTNRIIPINLSSMSMSFSHLSPLPGGGVFEEQPEASTDAWQPCSDAPHHTTLALRANPAARLLHDDQPNT